VRTLTERQDSPPLAPVTLTSFSLRSFPPKKGSSHPLNMASVAASHKDQGSMTCRHELTSTQRANALKSTTMVHSKTKHKVATPFLSLSLFRTKIALTPLKAYAEAYECYHLALCWLGCLLQCIWAIELPLNQSNTSKEPLFQQTEKVGSNGWTDDLLGGYQIIQYPLFSHEAIGPSLPHLPGRCWAHGAQGVSGISRCQG